MSEGPRRRHALQAVELRVGPRTSQSLRCQQQRRSGARGREREQGRKARRCFLPAVTVGQRHGLSTLALFPPRVSFLEHASEEESLTEEEEAVAEEEGFLGGFYSF